MAMQCNGILIVAFSFSPSARVGAKRFSFLSKKMEKECRNLHVLTVKKKYYDKIDDSLTSGGVIHRAIMFPPYPIIRDNVFKKIFNRLWEDYLCLIDPHSGWIFPGLTKGLKIIKQNKIEIIIATGPPFSNLVIGCFLSVLTKTKLIVDYRDPWTNMSRTNLKGFKKNINAILEKFVYKVASVVVFCSKKMKENFINDFGKYSDKGYYVINNGFEKINLIEPKYLAKKKINMIYAGEFYGERSISLLSGPIIALLKEGIITKENFCFHIFGKLKTEDIALIQNQNLKDIIIEHGLVPHKELLGFLKGADILVLIISRNMSYSVSYKFYDYLSAKRPILAIVPENSEMDSMMKKIDCGRIAFINSPQSIYENFRLMLLKKREYSFFGTEKFTWDEAAKKYLKVIKTTLKLNFWL